MIYISNPIEYNFIESIVDGEGIRLVIFLNGCNHHCKNCQNPSTWKKEKGIPFKINELGDIIVKRYNEGKFYNGITFSGGDPILQHKKLLELIIYLKYNIKDLNIWCYTGYSYENIKNLEILKVIDVLVDGKYEEDKKYPHLKFRGSNNQRIIYLEKGIIKKIE